MQYDKKIKEDIECEFSDQKKKKEVYLIFKLPFFKKFIKLKRFLKIQKHRQN